MFKGQGRKPRERTGSLLKQFTQQWAAGEGWGAAGLGVSAHLLGAAVYTLCSDKCQWSCFSPSEDFIGISWRCVHTYNEKPRVQASNAFSSAGSGHAFISLGTILVARGSRVLSAVIGWHIKTLIAPQWKGAM